MASVQDESCLSHYRKFLIKLSLDLSSKDLEMLTFAAVDFIPRGQMENIRTGLQFFNVLEQDIKIGPRNMSLLQDMFQTIGRVDLARRIQSYLTGSVKVESDGERDTVTTDGGGDNIPENTETSQLEGEPVRVAKSEASTSSVQLVRQPLSRSAADSEVFSARDGEQQTPQVGQCLAVMYNDVSSSAGNIQGPSSGLMVPAPAPSHAGEQRGAQALSSGRVQHDPSIGPAPVRYVNFLACGGYTVEIIGGKHFKTPEGEFVELKSGTQYKIHVKNTHAYGCHLDISIDGYDIGGWAVDGGQELSIERPVKEAKKFTFYRVKTAPKEAGIESGRSENGVVKCVFTPEAFLNVPVLISSSLQPLDMNMPPSATVGDLKREVQSQLGKGLDPDQVLVLSNQVLSNCMRLRNLLEQLQASGNLRLIDVEMQITVKTSSGKTFLVTLHPGKAKVYDLMEQIERELDVPSRDQKLYLGSALLSEAPWKGLPRKLICNPQPTVDVKVPEYIDITVEDQNGDSHTVKIDKEKSLTALIKQIPSCSYLQENEEAIFFFNGKPLPPSKDKGTLTSIGLCSGSKLELKVNVSFLQIFVDVWFSKYEKYAISIRCSPEETFKDLVKKVELPLGTRERNLEKVTFAMDGRIFDPEKDKGPLKDYGIKHHSQLQMRLVRPTPEVNTADDSQIPLEAKVSELAKFSDQLKKEIELQDVALDTLQCSDQVVREASSVKGTKEKKSFLSAIKRKLRPRKHEEMTVPRPPPPLSSTASSDFRRLKGGVAQCGASSPPRQQQQEEEQQHFDEWEDYRLWAQGPRKAADFPGLKGAVAHCGALSPPRQQQEQEEKEQHFDECGDCHMWAQGPRESAADKGEEYETYDEVYNAAPESADEWRASHFVTQGRWKSADEWGASHFVTQGRRKSAGKLLISPPLMDHV